MSEILGNGGEAEADRRRAADGGAVPERPRGPPR